jgi:DNA-binding transcriptional ArsR family regulator
MSTTKIPSTELRQLRVLADPLRVRILRALAHEPRTTAQVAELLGENDTRLYHHVRALERVNLIRLVETRPKRGTTEKYYQAVPPEVNKRSSRRGAADLAPLLNALLDMARYDVLVHLPSAGEEGAESTGILALRLVLHGNAQNRAATRARVAKFLQQLAQKESKRKIKPDDEAYALTAILSPTGESKPRTK